MEIPLWSILGDLCLVYLSPLGSWLGSSELMLSIIVSYSSRAGDLVWFSVVANPLKNIRNIARCCDILFDESRELLAQIIDNMKGYAWIGIKNIQKTSKTPANNYKKWRPKLRDTETKLYLLRLVRKETSRKLMNERIWLRTCRKEWSIFK